MPLKLGLPSTRAGRVAPACPDVCVIEAETTAPKAAAATATVISEPERRSSMLFPPFFTLAHVPIGKPVSTFPGHALYVGACPDRKSGVHFSGTCALLLQRIGFLISRCIILGQRIGALAFRKLAVLLARRLHHGRESLVALDAARLVVDPVLGLALAGEILLDGPGAGPHGRILDGGDVFEHGRALARPPLDEMQVLARAAVVGLGAEIGHVDHERVALPVAARVAEPLPDAGRQMRASVHDDAALPSLPL